MLQKNIASSSLSFGDPILTAVHRALGEIQGNRPFALTGEDGVRFVLALDGSDDHQMAAFVDGFCGGEADLVISGVRARMMKLTPESDDGAVLTPVTSISAGGPDMARVMEIATALKPDAVPSFTPAGRTAGTAVDLAKLAQRIPACLVSRPVEPTDDDETLITVRTEDVEVFRARLAATLKPVSEARVPIADGIASRFVIFRNAIGGIATAVIVGEPDATAPLPVRVHSSCATGDIFGSRRCDCGEQLQLGLHRLEELGGGCLIYLDQEGRGLGLANKMHAYTLQDQGLDTVDANMVLGFHDDERDYHAAGFMLKRLGWERITLLTNNPTKLTGLAAAGIEISDRLPVVTKANADNRRYLETKARRAGHLLGTAGLLETV
ncbi:GTP cyclohydrolase II [Breoghania corrubedonensis]|uniref:GTP cyclohydrolase-2 n=1 Tax=Breoghania corrubedonensis TaxID=665038 RepID=A0A2T5VFA3_9HYPH|nr:GTP cyclohydrolase II RibA [Breoghania corrubedonensis]PTW62445.1 GTP cyclohydrolase II [Breoghania corrubedonensis]